MHGGAVLIIAGRPALGDLARNPFILEKPKLRFIIIVSGTSRVIWSDDRLMMGIGI